MGAFAVPLEKRLEIMACKPSRIVSDLFRHTPSHDFPVLVSDFRSEIDRPVGRLDELGESAVLDPTVPQTVGPPG